MNIKDNLRNRQATLRGNLNDVNLELEEYNRHPEYQLAEKLHKMLCKNMYSCNWQDYKNIRWDIGENKTYADMARKLLAKHTEDEISTILKTMEANW